MFQHVATESRQTLRQVSRRREVPRPGTESRGARVPPATRLSGSSAQWWRLKPRAWLPVIVTTASRSEGYWNRWGLVSMMIARLSVVLSTKPKGNIRFLAIISLSPSIEKRTGNGLSLGCFSSYRTGRFRWQLSAGPTIPGVVGSSRLAFHYWSAALPGVVVNMSVLVPLITFFEFHWCLWKVANYG